MHRLHIEKSRSSILVIIIIAGLMISSFFLVSFIFWPDMLNWQNSEDRDNVNNADSTSTNSNLNNTYQSFENLSLIVDFANGTIESILNFNISVKDPSVFGLLNEYYTIDYDEYVFGKLVTSINGISNNVENNMYWYFWVNGIFSNIGSARVSLQNHDKIEWSYRNANNITFNPN